MRSRILLLFAILAFFAPGMDPARAVQPLEGTAVDSCAPWDGKAAEIKITLNSGKLFVARVWQPEKLPAGVTIDNAAEGGATAGNASICDDPEKTHFMDCKPVAARISLIEPKEGGDTAAGTLYIDSIGTFPINIHWTHTPQFCG